MADTVTKIKPTIKPNPTPTEADGGKVGSESPRPTQGEGSKSN